MIETMKHELGRYPTQAEVAARFGGLTPQVVNETVARSRAAEQARRAAMFPQIRGNIAAVAPAGGPEPLGRAEERRLALGLGPRQRVREYEARKAQEAARAAELERAQIVSAAATAEKLADAFKKNADAESRRLAAMAKIMVANIEAASEKYKADKNAETELQKSRDNLYKLMLTSGIREENAKRAAEAKSLEDRKKVIMSELVTAESAIDKNWGKRALVLYELDPAAFMEVAAEHGWHTSSNPIIQTTMQYAVSDFVKRLSGAGGAQTQK